MRPRGGENTIHPSLTMPAATLDTHKKVKRINSWREVPWFRSLVGEAGGGGLGRQQVWNSINPSESYIISQVTNIPPLLGHKCRIRFNKSSLMFQNSFKIPCLE